MSQDLGNDLPGNLSSVSELRGERSQRQPFISMMAIAESVSGRPLAALQPLVAIILAHTLAVFVAQQSALESLLRLADLVTC